MKGDEDMNELKNKTYDVNVWRRIIEMTHRNYENMIRRLSRKSKISNFVLIYYSIFLIMSSLTCKYFPHNYNSQLADYFNIILSVILLAYSLVNNSANYSIRINNIVNSLNRIKKLKRNLDNENLESSIAEYNEINANTERRENADFFIAIKQLSKSYGINWLTKKPYNKERIKEDIYIYNR